MKKFYLPVAFMAVASLPALGQSLILRSIEATDGAEETVYEYNEYNKVFEMRMYDGIDPNFNSITRLTYDDLQREIRSDLYQDINQIGDDNIEHYRHCAYIEFTYDDNGRVYKRVNYNNLAPSTATEPEFYMGGIMIFTYDDEGRMTAQNTYFSEPLESPFMKVEYEYGSNGKLVKETNYQDNWMGGMDITAEITYEYDEDGHLVKKTNSVADFSSGELTVSGGTEYSYDEDGSLIEERTISRSGSILDKKVYNYDPDAILASDVIFPYIVDETTNNEFYSSLYKAPETCDVYGINDMTGNLEFAFAYEYNYDGLNGVITIAAEKNEGMVVTGICDGKLMLRGVADGTVMHVYSTDGRHVSDTRVNNGNADMSGLAGGTYIITTANGAAKVRF